MKKIIIGVSIILGLMACNSKKEEKLTAQDIIDKAILEAGGTKYEHSKKAFVFRKKKYLGTHENGKYLLERIIKDSARTIHDKLSNNGLERSVNDSIIKVPDSLITRVSDGVNSVHYFAYLPYGLNAQAVNKKLVGETIINNNPYYEIEVSFNQEGGGTDYEDEFMYWIHKDKYTVDFLAYKYAVNGGGIRFREAYNARNINGLRFVDYKNYKTDDLKTELHVLDSLFGKNQLKLLSKIELEDIQVDLTSECC